MPGPAPKPGRDPPSRLDVMDETTSEGNTSATNGINLFAPATRDHAGHHLRWIFVARNDKLAQ